MRTWLKEIDYQGVEVIVIDENGHVYCDICTYDEVISEYPSGMWR